MSSSSKKHGGATAIEYGLIAALIAVAAITAMQGLSEQLQTTFEVPPSTTLEVPKGCNFVQSDEEFSKGTEASVVCGTGWQVRVRDGLMNGPTLDITQTAPLKNK